MAKKTRADYVEEARKSSLRTQLQKDFDKHAKKYANVAAAWPLQVYVPAFGTFYLHRNGDVESLNLRESPRTGINMLRANPTELRRSRREALERRPRAPTELRRSRREALERRLRAPWTIVAEMKAGEPGTEYGIDAVTPVAWIVSRHTIRRREYGYGLPEELTNSPAFAQWMAGAKSKRVIESLARMRATFRQMLPLRKNPAPRRLNAAPEVKQAAKLYEDFTGKRPTKLRRASVRAPKVAVDIGPVLAVAYRTTRDGKREDYLHEFRRGARPTLAASNDGRSLYLLGGAYRFTERGIVDD